MTNVNKVVMFTLYTHNITEYSEDKYIVLLYDYSEVSTFLLQNMTFPIDKKNVFNISFICMQFFLETVEFTVLCTFCTNYNLGKC